MRNTRKTELHYLHRGDYLTLGFLFPTLLACIAFTISAAALVAKRERLGFGSGSSWTLGAMAIALIAGILGLKLRGRRRRSSKANDFFDQTPVPHYELDSNGAIRRVNLAACGLLGFEPQALLGKALLTLIADSELADTVKSLNSRQTTHGPQEPWESRFVCRTGDELWLESHDVILNDAKGRISGIRGALIDVTRRRNALEAQHEGELAHRRQFNDNLAVMLLIDPIDGQIIDANLAALNFYGYPKDLILRMTFTGLNSLPCEDQNALARLTQGESAMLDFQHRLADGSGRYVEVLVSSVQLGPRIVLHCIVQDISERKRAQQVLQQSEDKHRRLLANLPIAILIVNPANSAIEFANDHASSLFGGSVDQLMGRACNSVFSSECSASRSSDLAGPIESLCQTLARADGSHLPILKSAKRIELDGAERLLECFIDLTEHHRAESTLRESEKRYRQLFDGSSDALLIVDPPTWKFTAANRSACQLFGVDNIEDFKDLGPWDISPELQPDGAISLEKAVAFTQQALTNGSASFEWLHCRRDGVEFHATVLLTRMEMNGQPYVQATVREITLQQRAEEALRESEAKHRLLIENSYGIIYTLNPDAVFTFVSLACTVLLGHAVRDVIGKTLWHFLHPDDHAEARSRIQSLFETGKTNDGFECRVRHIDGSWRWHNTGAIVLRDKAGKVFSIEGTARDITERKGVEDALKASEARLRAITDSALDAIIMQDFSGDITFWNPAAELIFGYSPQEALGQNLCALLAPEKSRESLQEAFFEFMRTGRRHEPGRATGFTARHKDGSEISAEMTLSTIEREGKRHAVGIVRDVTARNLVEAELRNSREQYALVIEGCDEGIWDWDIQKDSHYWSPRWCQMIGYRSDEFPPTRADFIDHIHPDDRQRVLDELSRYLRNEIPNYCLEYRLRHKDGSYLWIMARGAALRDNDGVAYRVAGSHSDITRRRQDEAMLAESAARLMLAARAGGIGIWDWDVVNSRLVWDDQMLRLYGITRELFQSSYPGWVAAVHPDDRERGDREIRMALNGERDFDTEFRVVWPDASVHSIRAMALVRRDAMGQPLNLIGTNWDTTAQNQAADKLRETNRELQAATERATELAARAEVANTAKSEFLANMSHEIRTPMNGVIGMTGLLLDTELTAEQRHYAEIVRGSGESLLGIINDILDFSKIEAGKLDLEILDFDLEAVLDDLSDTLALPAFEKGLELLSSADPEVPVMVSGDPGRLRQVLANLVGNAIKFTSTGEVAVHVSVVWQTETECLLRFTVRDTGIGIAGEKIGLLFTKFSQVDASTTRTYGGTGLGLAISKRLAGLMGGEIGVDSILGCGSEFWFSSRFHKQAQQRIPRGPTDLLRNVRVLLASGNAANRRIQNRRMTSWGMRCGEAGDAQSALLVLNQAFEERDPFQLVVIAPRMPGMDGEALAAAIQSDPRLAGTRMVLLSIPGTKGESQRRGDLRYSGTLMKPVRSSELLDVLSSALMPVTAMEPSTRRSVRRNQPHETLNMLRRRQARILLAEDNITNQQVAVAVLKKFGLRADAVANGLEAVEALKTVPYDLVLMDVQMPVMSGLEATMLIRNPHSEVRDHTIPIIAMTAHSMHGDRQRCLDAGMNDYLSKPVSFQSLAAALAHWLPAALVNSPAGVRSEDVQPAIHAVFDRTGMMDRLMNDEELAREITTCFLDDMPKQIAALRRYLDAGEASGVERQAHTIKGASSNVGGDLLRGVASEIEQATKCGNLASVAGRLGDLEYEFTRLKDAMENQP